MNYADFISLLTATSFKYPFPGLRRCHSLSRDFSVAVGEGFPRSLQGQLTPLLDRLRVTETCDQRSSTPYQKLSERADHSETARFCRNRHLCRFLHPPLSTPNGVGTGGHPILSRSPVTLMTADLSRSHQSRPSSLLFGVVSCGIRGLVAVVVSLPLLSRLFLTTIVF